MSFVLENMMIFTRCNFANQLYKHFWNIILKTRKELGMAAQSWNPLSVKTEARAQQVQS